MNNDVKPFLNQIISMGIPSRYWTDKSFRSAWGIFTYKIEEAEISKRKKCHNGEKYTKENFEIQYIYLTGMGKGGHTSSNWSIH